MRPYVLAEANLKSVRDNPPEAVVLPWGATEPHNLHMPYATDTITTTRIGELICQRAFEQGARVYLLPTVPFGVNTNQSAYPLTINMNPSTQLAVIRDVVASLKAADIRKMLILNGHGGNDFNPMQRELYDCGVFIAVCNWWQVGDDIASEIFEKSGEHADEMESSVGLHLFADLMGPLSQADSGTMRETRFAAINKGWVRITRPWHKFTTNSGAGDPAAATAEKGRRFVDEIVERLSQFLVELAKAEMDEAFPY